MPRFDSQADIVQVFIPEEISGRLLDWMTIKGHKQFRKYLRKNAGMEDNTHLHVIVNYIKDEITIEMKEGITNES